jgi:hypothetical protein
MTDITDKVKWYVKYRSQIWATTFLIIGLLGGNVDRLKNAIPSLNTVDETQSVITQEQVNKFLDEAYREAFLEQIKVKMREQAAEDIEEWLKNREKDGKKVEKKLANDEKEGIIYYQ